MPQLTIPLLDAGAFLDVGVGASRGLTGPANRPGTWRALIDTGADATAISPAIVSALQPQKLGMMPISRVGGGRSFSLTYDVRLRFGGPAGPGRWYLTEAVEARPVTPGVDVLIGMDLLIRIDMQWIGSSRLVTIDH